MHLDKGRGYLSTSYLEIKFEGVSSLRTGSFRTRFFKTLGVFGCNLTGCRNLRACLDDKCPSCDVRVCVESSMPLHDGEVSGIAGSRLKPCASGWFSRGHPYGDSMRGISGGALKLCQAMIGNLKGGSNAIEFGNGCGGKRGPHAESL